MRSNPKSMRGPAIGCGIVLVCSLAISMGAAGLHGLPVPLVHDEYANLLQADTFAHARMTNPTPPMPMFFETMHELMVPSYQSKFPPGLSLVMAFGQILWRPILGVWLCMAVACAAATAFFFRLLTPPVAITTGLLLAISPVINYWSESYWGGELSLLGGVAVLWAGLALRERYETRDAIIGGVGAGLLMVSRPFEGMLLCLLIGGLTSWTLFRNRRAGQLFRSAAIAALSLLPIVAAEGYYNWRVTQSPWQLPYTLYSAQYMYAPNFFWLKPNVPTLKEPETKHAFHAMDEVQEYSDQVSLQGRLRGVCRKLFTLARAYLSPYVLLIPLVVGVGMAGRSSVARWAILICIVIPILQGVSSPWFRLQYLACLMPPLFLLVGLGISRIAAVRKVGVWLAGLLVVGHATLSLRWIISHGQHPTIAIALREQTLERLGNAGGRHLVFVHYRPNHDVGDELVYNPADILAAPVLFVHELGDENDQALIGKLPGRSTWLLDEQTQTLSPFIQR